jgi:hypothetical protein
MYVVIIYEIRIVLLYSILSKLIALHQSQSKPNTHQNSCESPTSIDGDDKFNQFTITVVTA